MSSSIYHVSLDTRVITLHLYWYKHIRCGIMNVLHNTSIAFMYNNEYYFYTSTTKMIASETNGSLHGKKGQGYSFVNVAKSIKATLNQTSKHYLLMNDNLMSNLS